MEEIAVKQTYLRSLESLVEPPLPTKDSIAYTRYGDQKIDRDGVDMDTKYLFEFPRGKPYSIINSGELFRVQKTADHFDQLRRSKSFIADTYFGPFSVKESNLRSLFIEQKAVWENEWNQAKPTEAYLAWKEQLLEAIPRLNHNVLVEFALYLTFEAKFNDIKVWRAVEEAAYPILHHLTLTQIC